MSLFVNEEFYHLTDQSERGLPYSVFGGLAVKLVFTEATDQAQLVML